MVNKNYVLSLALLASIGILQADAPQTGMAKIAPQTTTSTIKAPKVVVIGMQQILAELDEGKAGVKELMGKQQEWEKKLKLRETEIKNRATALQAKMKTAKPEALERDNEEIERLNREYKNMASEANTTLQKAQQKTLVELQKKVQKHVKELAPKYGWNIAIAQEAGILHVDEEYKVNDIVVKEMNAQYKKTKAPAPAAKSAAETTSPVKSN